MAEKDHVPKALKRGVEALSGITLDGVKVHRNSELPAHLAAHAFAQGADIHVAPGQEQHTPHEAWHVVQQKSGRVTPKARSAEGAQIKASAGLDAEADVMGSRATKGGS